MIKYQEHLILSGSLIKEALNRLNYLAADAILFVVDEKGGLIGSLTDGDVRRGLMRGLGVEDRVNDFLQPNPKFLRKGQYCIEDVIAMREANFIVIPVLNEDDRVVNVINFRYRKSYLPVDAVIMAGGRGTRLRPMTDSVPKPLLRIGEKPIIEHNLDRLSSFGIDDSGFWISLRYLGKQVEAYFGLGTEKNINIQYVWEDHPLGTIGSVSKIQNFQNDFVLVTNSDILTTINYEDFFLDFIERDAEMSVATIPYSVDIPYAVLETSNNHVISFREKPTYTYYSNGGIYLFKRSVLSRIPKNCFFNSTDLMQNIIETNGKLVSFPVHQYWLDIGKPEDFEKAQKDIKHLDLE